MFIAHFNTCFKVHHIIVIKHEEDIKKLLRESVFDILEDLELCSFNYNKRFPLTDCSHAGNLTTFHEMKFTMVSCFFAQIQQKSGLESTFFFLNFHRYRPVFECFLQKNNLARFFSKIAY